MKMVSLKRTAAEKKAEGSADGMSNSVDDSRDGADLHLEDNHMEKMGISPNLPHGHPITLHAEGTIHRASDGPEGSRMTIRVHKAGAEYDDPKEQEGGLRGEIEKNTQDADKKALTKPAAKGKDVPEQDNKTVQKAD